MFLALDGDPKSEVGSVGWALDLNLDDPPPPPLALELSFDFFRRVLLGMSGWLWASSSMGIGCWVGLGPSDESLLSGEGLLDDFLDCLDLSLVGESVMLPPVGCFLDALGKSGMSREFTHLELLLLESMCQHFQP